MSGERRVPISEIPAGALTAESPWTLCGQCDRGVVWGGLTCTCDPGPEGQHHPYCGAHPCPNGCFEQLRKEKP